LIGFWYEKDSASNAGKKAFVVNRVGDFGFILGMFLLFTSLGKHGIWTLDFTEVFAHASKLDTATVTTITILLFVGACGKSAQIPIYVWLPDAMEGPTPVSSLIHAATMVTAGVYMVARCNVLYSMAPIAMAIVAIVGVATAFYWILSERYQKSVGLFYNQPIGIYVPGRRSGRIQRWNLPSDDPCFLQRAPFPWRWERHACPKRRTGYEKDGGSQKKNSLYFLDFLHRHTGDRRNSWAFRIF
jgi:hypothetical protein